MTIERASDAMDEADAMLIVGMLVDSASTLQDEFRQHAQNIPRETLRMGAHLLYCSMLRPAIAKLPNDPALQYIRDSAAEAFALEADIRKRFGLSTLQ
jgi:hypothetical protein